MRASTFSTRLNLQAGRSRDIGHPTANRIDHVGQQYCWWHDSANKEQRQQTASKAGRARALKGQMKEIRTIKGQLAELYTVIRGDEDIEVDTKPASCLIQISQAQLKAIETQRKEKQAEEFERRLEDLEKKLEEKKPKGVGLGTEPHTAHRAHDR